MSRHSQLDLEPLVFVAGYGLLNSAYFNRPSSAGLALITQVCLLKKHDPHISSIWLLLLDFNGGGRATCRTILPTSGHCGSTFAHASTMRLAWTVFDSMNESAFPEVCVRGRTIPKVCSGLSSGLSLSCQREVFGSTLVAVLHPLCLSCVESPKVLFLADAFLPLFTPLRVHFAKIWYFCPL